MRYRLPLTGQQVCGHVRKLDLCGDEDIHTSFEHKGDEYFFEMRGTCEKCESEMIDFHKKALDAGEYKNRLGNMDPASDCPKCLRPSRKEKDGVHECGYCGTSWKNHFIFSHTEIFT